MTVVMIHIIICFICQTSTYHIYIYIIRIKDMYNLMHNMSAIIIGEEVKLFQEVILMTN